MNLFLNQDIGEGKGLVGREVTIYENSAVVDSAQVLAVTPATEDKPLEMKVKSTLFFRDEEFSFSYDPKADGWKFVCPESLGDAPVFGRQCAYRIRKVDSLKPISVEEQQIHIFFGM